MVEAITPISATAASSPTRIDTSTSITSEPDNAWVAARQSQITTDQLAMKRATERHEAHDTVPDTVVEERHGQARHGEEAADDTHGTAEEAEHPTFSGESERIGTWNFDDDTPFGDRVAIV